MVAASFKHLILFGLLFYSAYAQSPPQLRYGATVSQQAMRAGGTIFLECPVRSSRGLIFEWFKGNDSTVTFGDNRLRVMGNGSLRIKDIVLDDAGEYRCRAVNGFGSVEYNTSLIVIGTDENAKNSLLLSGKNCTVQKGEKAVMECEIRSKSFPHIEWLKQVKADELDEKLWVKSVQIDGEFFSIITVPYVVDYTADEGIYRHQLIIENAKVEDAGKYVCVAANTFGREYGYAFLHIIPKSSPSSFLSVGVVSTIGAVGLLICIASVVLLYYYFPCCGKPRCSMTLTKDFLRLRPSRSSINSIKKQEECPRNQTTYMPSETK